MSPGAPTDEPAADGRHPSAAASVDEATDDGPDRDRRETAESDESTGDPDDADDADAASDEPDAEATATAAETDGGEEDATDADAPPDPTAATVELELHQLAVSVQGRADDELATVATTAREAMNELVERARELDDYPDDRGLS